MYKLLLFLFAISANAHPFYVSILEIHYNQTENTLECALKLFTDDLENAISDYEGTPMMNLGTSTEPDDADKRVWNYVNAHVQLNNHQLHYVGREGDVDAQWIYFEIPLQKNSDAVFTWSTLIHILPSQKNILQLHMNDSQQTFIFDRRKTKHTLSLQP